MYFLVHGPQDDVWARNPVAVDLYVTDIKGKEWRFEQPLAGRGTMPNLPGLVMEELLTNEGVPPTRLDVTYGGATLEGQTISVDTIYPPADDDEANPADGEYFHLADLSVANLDSHSTGAVSAQLLFTKKVRSDDWLEASSGEPGFQSAFYVPVGGLGTMPSRLKAQKAATLRDFWGLVKTPWSSEDVISAKLELFYGAERPIVFNFKIKKKRLLG